jgi:hypothetical protein
MACSRGVVRAGVRRGVVAERGRQWSSDLEQAGDLV